MNKKLIAQEAQDRMHVFLHRAENANGGEITYLDVREAIAAVRAVFAEIVPPLVEAAFQQALNICSPVEVQRRMYLRRAIAVAAIVGFAILFVSGLANIIENGFVSVPQARPRSGIQYISGAVHDFFVAPLPSPKPVVNIAGPATLVIAVAGIGVAFYFLRRRTTSKEAALRAEGVLSNALCRWAETSDDGSCSGAN